MNQNVLTSIVVALLLVAGGWLYFGKDMKEEGTKKNVDMLLGNGSHDVATKETEYFAGAKGYFAYPTEAGNYPGVVMIHEWWGLNGNIKDMARELASHGYQVLAVDLYKGEVADTAERARTLVSSLDQTEANENLKSAVVHLRNQNAAKIASLGWCFGGGQSLQLSLSGEKLDGTIIYYGSLVTDQNKLGAISWPVLGIFGEKDTSISVESVNQFHGALDSLGVMNQVHVYPGVGHAFANPSGANYAPEETADAWQKTLAFLAQTLK
jgi:carboxymethylenebutenolidase